VNKRGLFMARLNTLGANEASSDKMREMHSFEILKNQLTRIVKVGAWQVVVQTI